MNTTFRLTLKWVVLCALLLFLSSCTFATMKQIRSAFDDQYFKQLNKKSEQKNLKKLRKFWKKAYRIGCKDQSRPCRLGDALEQKFHQLLTSCGIKQMLNGKWTRIPPDLQNSLSLNKPVAVFEEDSIQRLFRFLFTSREMSEYQKLADQEERFLPSRVLANGRTTLPIPETKAISYRQTCSSLIQAGLKMSLSFGKKTLESALKSQYDAQSFKELLVLRGRFLSPLFFNLNPSNNTRRQNVLFHVWMAYSKMQEQLKKGQSLPRLKYLQSLRGVTTFETKRGARKVELKVNAGGKTDLWFVDVGGKTRIKYKGNKTFSFRDFATFVFRHKNGKKLKAQIANLPTPAMLQNEIANQKFRVTPNRSILIPGQRYRHRLTVPGLPQSLCNPSQWSIRRVEKGSKRWIPLLRLGRVRPLRLKGQKLPSCVFEVEYKMKRVRTKTAQYILHYHLVGREGSATSVGKKLLVLKHKSEFSPTDQPQLRFSLPTLARKRPKDGQISKGDKLLLQWDIPIRITDGKNRVQKVLEIEELQALCEDGKQLTLREHRLTPRQPRKNGKLQLSFKAQMGVHSKVQVQPGAWRSCDLEMRVRLRVSRPSKKSEVERIVRGKIQVPKILQLSTIRVPTTTVPPTPRTTPAPRKTPTRTKPPAR